MPSLATAAHVSSGSLTTVKRWLAQEELFPLKEACFNYENGCAR